MNDTIKIFLFALGLVLLGFGLYTLISPDTLLNMQGIADGSQSTGGQSAFLITFGIIMLAGSIYSKDQQELA